MNSFALYFTDGKKLRSERTLVMGILNATPDSFSDGGELSEQAALEKRIKSMIGEGVDVLDVGGESTRPGHKKVAAREELERILPVVKTIRKISKSIPISIDTQKSSVAQAALEAGASFINDVSALSDKEMAAVSNRFGCSAILMRGESTGPDVIGGCKRQFEAIIKKAAAQGLNKDRVLLDPGLGFGSLADGNYKVPPGSDPNANMLLIISIQKYSLGLPVVIGASRKRFIGDITGEKSAKDRLAGSLAAAILAQQAGAAIVRVHDVGETVRAFKTLGS